MTQCSSKSALRDARKEGGLVQGEEGDPLEERKDEFWSISALEATRAGVGGGLELEEAGSLVELRSTGTQSRSISNSSKSALTGVNSVEGTDPSIGLGSRPVLVEVGVAPPGTHVTYQTREPKPKTGGSRAGGPSRGSTPTSDTGSGTNNKLSNTIWEEEHEGAFSMLELAGDLR